MPSTDFYLLGLLNSKLIWYFLLRACPVLGDPDKGGRLTQQWVYVKTIPIRQVKEDEPCNKYPDIIANRASEMLALHERLAGIKAEADRQIIERQIKATDKEIDQLVYEIYGLSEEEIKIIEETG